MIMRHALNDMVYKVRTAAVFPFYVGFWGSSEGIHTLNLNESQKGELAMLHGVEEAVTMSPALL